MGAEIHNPTRSEWLLELVSRRTSQKHCDSVVREARYEAVSVVLRLQEETRTFSPECRIHSRLNPPM
jgi:hypothetical protein